MGSPSHNITLQASLEYPNIALGLVGSLGEIHEAALAEKDENVVNPLIPQRIPFQQWTSGRRQTGGTIFAQRPSALWPFVPGVWHVAPLISRFRNNNVITTATSGAVFWSHDAIGPTCEDAAQAIRNRICLNNAGMYNCNQEPEEFEAAGGRIVGRYTWEPQNSGGPRNAALDKTSAYKLQANIMEQAHWGPELWLAASSTHDDYLSTTWPFVKEQEAYTLTDTSAGLLSNESSSFVRIFLSAQEYLAGRILTTTVRNVAAKPTEGSNDEASCTAEEGTTVAQLLVVFTYSAPEDMDDAYVQDVLVSGQPQLQSPALFQGFLVEQQESSDDQAISVALESVSLSKQMSLLDWGVWGQEAGALWKNQPPNERYAMHQRLLRILCEIHHGDGRRRHLLSALYSQLCEIRQSRALVESGVLGVKDAGLLSLMIADAQARYEASKNEYYPDPPSVLLESIASVAGAKAIMESGVPLQLSVVVGSIGHVDMPLLQFFIDELLVQHDHSVLSPLAAAAAKILSLDSFKDIISRMKKTAISDLFDEVFFIDGPPPYDKYPELSDETGEPPHSKSTLRQVVAEAFIENWFAYEKHLCSVEKCKLQNAAAEASGSGMRCYVTPPEPFDVSTLMEMVSFMEHIAPMEGQLSEQIQAYTPNTTFWNHFIWSMRYERGFIESIGTTVEELLESAKKKLSEIIMEFFQSSSKAATRS